MSLYPTFMETLEREWYTEVDLDTYRVAVKIKELKEKQYSERNGLLLYPTVEQIFPDGNGKFVLIWSRLTDLSANEYRNRMRRRSGYGI